MIKKKLKKTIDKIVKTKLVKVDNIEVQEEYNVIDGELSFVIRNNLDYRIRRRRIKKYFIQNESDLVNNRSIVAKYNKIHQDNYGNKKQKEVLICMFRISKDYIQENYICNNKVKTSYYKIKFGG